MKNLSYKKTLTEKIQIKGVLSDDGTVVMVSDKDGDFEVVLQDFINRFAGEYVEFAFATKMDEDLTDELQ